MDVQKLFSVEGKVVCVTGGGSGIGRTVADGFVSGGARVYIASRRDLAGVARELSEQGPGECIGLQADVSREADIVGLAETLREREGKLDVLVNNAGLGVVSHRFEEFPLDDFDRLQAVNVRGIFAMTKECLPLLEEGGKSGGHAAVINIGSIDGIRIPSDNDWAYGLSKAAVHHLTRQLAGRMGNRGGRRGGRNVTFNAVAPGPFPGMLDNALKNPEIRDAIAGATSVGRVGTAEDMAGVCIYLASRAGEYVTGVLLPVDGGVLVSRGANS